MFSKLLRIVVVCLLSSMAFSAYAIGCFNTLGISYVSTFNYSGDWLLFNAEETDDHTTTGFSPTTQEGFQPATMWDNIAGIEPGGYGKLRACSQYVSSGEQGDMISAGTIYLTDASTTAPFDLPITYSADFDILDTTDLTMKCSTTAPGLSCTPHEHHNNMYCVCNYKLPSK